MKELLKVNEKSQAIDKLGVSDGLKENLKSENLLHVNSAKKVFNFFDGNIF